MARPQLPEIRQKLQQSRRQTLHLICGIDEATALHRPQPQAWSVKEHVIHLIAVEEAIIHFAHRILSEECPISPLCHEIAFNQDAWNNREVLERTGYTWTAAVTALQESHHHLLGLLETIPETALNRIGSHPVWGDPVTLASILRIPYRHERAHRDEIAVLATLNPHPG